MRNIQSRIGQVQGLSTAQENELNCTCFNLNTSHHFSMLYVWVGGWVWKRWKVCLEVINKLGSLALHWEKLQIRGKIVTRRRYLKREHGKKVRKLKSKKRSLRNRKSKRKNDKKYSRGKKKQKENKKKSIPLDTCMLWNNWTVSHRRFIIHGLIEFVGKVLKSTNRYDYSIYRSTCVEL